MPGYFIHLASAPEKLRNSKIGLLGIIAPDLWKKHTPTELEYDKLFSKCVIDKPRYEEVLLLCDASHGGTHFGSEPSDTNHANFSSTAELLWSAPPDVVEQRIAAIRMTGAKIATSRKPTPLRPFSLVSSAAATFMSIGDTAISVRQPFRTALPYTAARGLPAGIVRCRTYRGKRRAAEI